MIKIDDYMKKSCIILISIALLLTELGELSTWNVDICRC